MSSCRRWSVLCLAAALAPLPGPRAQEPPSFPSEVELITVDAVVLDAHGRPVPGLTRDDFTILEDGRPQEIASFEAFALDARAAELPEPGAVASNESGAPRLQRAFALLLDDLQLSAPLVEAARRLAASFIERTLRDGDEALLGTTSGEVWWSARLPEGRDDLLAVLARVKGRAAEAAPGFDHMSEYEAFRIANYEDAPGIADGGPGPGVTLQGGSVQANEPLPSGGAGGTVQRVRKRWQEALLCVGRQCDSMVRARAAEIDSRRRTRLRLTFQALRRQLEALTPAHGRKSLLFLSDGFVHDPGGEQRRLAAASREANTAVYFLDLRGLVALPGFGPASDPARPPEAADQAAFRFEDLALASAGTETLADDTGGFTVRNSNDLAGSAWRIANESRVFYLLGFHPPPGKPAGRWRKLKVAVERPGLTVRARRGYTLRRTPERATPPARRQGELAVPAAVARALDSAHHEAGIPLRAMAYLFEPRPEGRTHVVVAAEFDAGRVTLAPRGARRVGRVELSVVALERDSGRGFRHDDTVEVALEAGETHAWRAFAREFELPAGVTQVRVVVHDPPSGAVGSVWQRLEVPPPGTLRVSTPILSDHAEPAPGGQGSPQPALAAHRVFPPAGRLYCQFQVFGATPLPGGGEPRVTAGLELTRDGRRVRSADPTPIAVDADGRIVRLVGLGLDGLAPGDYELRLAVQDQVARARLERVEAFTLAHDAAAR